MRIARIAFVTSNDETDACSPLQWGRSDESTEKNDSKFDLLAVLTSWVWPTEFLVRRSVTTLDYF